MEVVDNKYKKWGWGALIGLAAVIFVAAIAIGVSMNKPKATNAVNTVDGDSTQTVADNGNNGGNGANTNTNKDDQNGDEGRDNDADAKKDGTDTNNSGTGTNNSNNSSNANTNNGTNNNSNNSSNNSANKMPKTGPEDDMIAFVAWAVIAGLGAYYFLGNKKNA